MTFVQTQHSSHNRSVHVEHSPEKLNTPQGDILHNAIMRAIPSGLQNTIFDLSI